MRDLTLSVKAITYKNVQDSVHYLDAGVPTLAGYVGYYETMPGVSILPTRRVTEHSFLLTADRALREQLPLKNYIGIAIGVAITPMPCIVGAEVRGNTILVSTDIDISPRREVRFTFYDASSLRYVQDETSYLLVETFTAIFEPEAGWDDRPTLHANIELTTFDYFYVDHIVGGRTDHETLQAVVNEPEIMVTMVGPVPV